MKDKFDIVIVGVGGQGILTLAAVIARLAFREGWQVKASELHGLSTRYGSIEVHLRLARQEIYSPLVSYGKADLIISTEPAETLKACKYASKETAIIFSTKKIMPVAMYLEKKPYPRLDQIQEMLSKFSKKTIPVDTLILKKAGKPIVMENTFLLGKLAREKILPFKKELFIATLKEMLSAKSLQENLEVFELGCT